MEERPRMGGESRDVSNAPWCHPAIRRTHICACCWNWFLDTESCTYERGGGGGVAVAVFKEFVVNSKGWRGFTQRFYAPYVPHVHEV